MKKGILIFFLTLFTVNFSSPLHAAEKQNFITMNFPEAVIADALKRIVPLTFAGVSKTMEGSVTIAEISNLQLHDQKIFCHLKLMGNNLNLITTVANQDIRLKLGSAQVDFDCDAQIRYDAPRKTLFIRPVARGIVAEDALKSGDIGKALLLFLNGREFGIEMKELDPIIAEASDKTVTIQTQIMDIRTVKGALQLALAPAVSAQSRKQ